MSWLTLLNQSFRRLITAPIEELSRGKRSLRYTLDLARHCYIKLGKDRATETAAALTYHTLFSLLPTVVLMLVLFSAFKGLDEYFAFSRVGRKGSGVFLAVIDG